MDFPCEVPVSRIIPCSPGVDLSKTIYQGKMGMVPVVPNTENPLNAALLSLFVVAI